jgi:plasmid stability protein
MPVTLSIKNAPDDMVERLRERARRNHRSLQGEMLSILEQVVNAPPAAAPHEARAGNRVIRFEGEDEDR